MDILTKKKDDLMKQAWHAIHRSSRLPPSINRKKTAVIRSRNNCCACCRAFLCPPEPGGLLIIFPLTPAYFV